MFKILTALILTLCLTASAWAGERQEDKIEHLERDNYRLSMEVNRLREQVRDLQNMAARQRQYQYGSRGYGSYGYGQGPMSGAARQMDEMNRMKRSWEQLTR